MANMPYNYVPTMYPQFSQHIGGSSHNFPIVMNARTHASPSAPQQEYWLHDSGVTNQITNDSFNLHMEAPYPTNDTIICANGKGLTIANFGNFNLSTKSHNFRLNYVLHVP